MARDIATTEDYAPHGASERRSRCCSRISNASSGWTACDYEDPSGARDEFLLAATAQNLRKLASLSRCRPQPRRKGPSGQGRSAGTLESLVGNLLNGIKRL